MRGNIKRKGRLRSLFAGARRAYGVLAAHRYTTIAGTLVFFFVISVVPFLFWLLLLFGNTGVAPEEILELELFGWAKELLVFLLENAEGAGRGASIFFLATTLWSCTGFFYHLRRSGEIIYESDRAKQGWKVRLSALGLTFVLLLFFAAAVLVVLAGVYAVRFLSPWIAYPAEYILLFVVGFFAAWILNAYICPFPLGPSRTAPGSLLTAGLWLGASALFSVYLKFSGSEKLYGALSLVIVSLLFLYWMMICFTVGAIYNRCRIPSGDFRGKHP